MTKELTVIGYKGLLFLDGSVGGKPVDKDAPKITKDNLSPALINNPLDSGQLGFVLDLSKIYINQEAVTLLKQIKKSQDDIGDIDLFMGNNSPVIAWLGGPREIIDPKEMAGSKQYDISILDKANVIELPIPQGIVDFFENKEDLGEDDEL